MNQRRQRFLDFPRHSGRTSGLRPQAHLKKVRWPLAPRQVAVGATPPFRTTGSVRGRSTGERPPVISFANWQAEPRGGAAGIRHGQAPMELYVFQQLRGFHRVERGSPKALSTLNTLQTLHTIKKTLSILKTLKTSHALKTLIA